MTSPVIIWFRQDLRLADNPALHEAAQQDRPVIPVYILDDENAGAHKTGAAGRVWLHHSLTSLNRSLSGHMLFFKGDASKILPQILKDTGAGALYWNRCYEPWRISRDTRIKDAFDTDGIEVKSFNASLLWEPWTIKNKSGAPYKVFTPYYRKGCLQAAEPRQPLPAPARLHYASVSTTSLSLNDLDLLPDIPWDRQMSAHWDISEDGAQKQFRSFLKDGLAHYKEGRNFPAQPYVSRLSPYLHFGEISVRQLWHVAQDYAAHYRIPEKDIDTFCTELGWREFSYHLLYHFPSLPRQNLQPRFDRFPWPKLSPDHLKRWQTGQTGYPIVDAAMRELWQTGYMHNRCRMIAASFLIKHLMIHWHEGEKWFWDCLFDADLANNSASWQWVAGSGADAAPYFRIFNPITQGQTFDPQGVYIRTYVPELAGLPDKYLFSPWTAPKKILDQAGITLGKTYPAPIIDHMSARDRALSAFAHTQENL